jgi:hypothetical protein
VLIPDLVFPVDKIDREQSEKNVSKIPKRYCKAVVFENFLRLPIAQTHFDSPFEFESAKLYCITKHFKKCRFTAIQKDPTQLKK